MRSSRRCRWRLDRRGGTRDAAAVVDDDVRVEVDAIWSLLSMEIGAAETLNPARVLPTDGAN